jgi:hypothetical protein
VVADANETVDDDDGDAEGERVEEQQAGKKFHGRKEVKKISAVQ